MALADMQFSYNGLVFGEGTDVLVNSVDGLEGYTTRNSDADQPRGDGSIRGLDYAAARTIGFELSVWEPDLDGTLYESLWNRVRTVFAPRRDGDLPLVFKRPGQPERMVRCRPIQLVRSEEWNRFNRAGEPPLTMRAVDPRIYSTREHNAVVPIYSTLPTGIDFPIDFPMEYPPGARLEAVIRNEGSADAFPLLRFYGPQNGTCDAVTLTNATTGQVFHATPTGLSAGKILTADMTAAVTAADDLVVSIDGATRYGAWALPREPFALAPGDNVLRFQVEGTSTDVRCLVTWRSTWIS